MEWPTPQNVPEFRSSMNWVVIIRVYLELLKDWASNHNATKERGKYSMDDGIWIQL